MCVWVCVCVCVCVCGRLCKTTEKFVRIENKLFYLIFSPTHLVFACLIFIYIYIYIYI